MQIRTLIISLLVVCTFSGCSKEPRPAGMPRLYPVSLKIVQEGETLEGAMVQLIPEDSANSSWGPGGTTDASGIAVLQTNGKYKGAPLGKYKVTVSKKEKEPHPNPELAGGPEFRQYLAVLKTLKTYSFVEPQYGSIKDTPLRVEITANEKTYTIDAGKKIKTVVNVLE
jgi:hypothetical protein